MLKQEMVGKTFSTRLSEVMQQRGLTILDLYMKSGVNQATLCRYLNYNKYKILCAIASTLNVSIDWLLGNYDRCDYIPATQENLNLLFAYNVASESDKSIIDLIIKKYQEEKVQK